MYFQTRVSAVEEQIVQSATTDAINSIVNVQTIEEQLRRVRMQNKERRISKSDLSRIGDEIAERLTVGISIPAPTVQNQPESTTSSKTSLDPRDKIMIVAAIVSVIVVVLLLFSLF